METPTTIMKRVDLLCGRLQKVETAGNTELENRASSKLEEISIKMEREDRVSDLRELERYFIALEKDRNNLQNLLQEQREEHTMTLAALEREMIQERMVWDRQMREREEALLSAFMSVAISKEKLMKDLMGRMRAIKHLEETSGIGPMVSQEKKLRKLQCFRKHQAISDVSPQDTIHLGGTAGNGPAKSLDRQPRKWWCFGQHQTTPDFAPQETSSVTANTRVAALQQIAKLEERIRKAENKKQQKALKKAEKQAKKAEKKAMNAEKRAKREGQKAENRDDVIHIQLDGQDIVVHYPVPCSCLFCVFGRRRMARRKRQ
ncbi:hypothetical protein AALO_G00246150 [Alosa alosa]|uniref:Uncharacterized protein n=1 Tax=Alosa alosa TaxID=278164 RepID=A0AAV6FZG7_9TELE|nr:uncharacterized protein LOC125284466 [Alosa alosa]XP_048084379.1 uncharacterized protein LOC125284466 [Alosa alosa]KAG5265766.1 hypothetical protein AALO_G00246150 [Alosa alosa]